MNFEKSSSDKSEDNIEQEKVSQKKKKILSLQEDRIFSVDSKGSTEIIGDSKLKLQKKIKNNPVETKC